MVRISGPAKASEHRGHGNYEGGVWATRNDLDGDRDYGFDVRMQQWFDSGRSANLLRDGPRWSLLQERRNPEFTPCSSGGVNRPGYLDLFADVAANGDG